MKKSHKIHYAKQFLFPVPVDVFLSFYNLLGKRTTYKVNKLKYLK